MAFTLIYVSDSNISPFGGFASVQFEAIETKSQQNNDRLNVNGFLFYHQSRFLQILQGEFDDVIKIFGKIKSDTRHSNVRIVSFSNMETHLFSKWAMLNSMNYVSDNFKKLTIEPSIIARFVPDRGHLSPTALKCLLDLATHSVEEINDGIDVEADLKRLYG